MRKNIFISGFFITLLAFFGLFSSAVLNAQSIEDDPYAYVEDVVLEEDTVSQGNIVYGTFVVRNGSNIPIDDITYTVSLTGAYENGLPLDFYDSQNSTESFDLGPNAQKIISFSYKTPTNVSGEDLGIEIEIFQNTGISLGWNYSPLIITGSSSFLELTNALIFKGEEAYVLDFGPTFFDDELPEIGISFVNNTDKNISFTPRATFSNYQDRDVVILEELYTGDSVNVGEEKTITLKLPTFDRKAGVYFGNMTFEDSEGVAVAPSVAFQYIIDGDIATIHNAVFDDISYSKGDQVNLSLTLSGKPLALETAGEEQELLGYVLYIEVMDENGNVVFSKNESINTLTDSEIKNISFEASSDIKYPLAKIEIKKDVNVLASYSSEVPDWLVDQNGGVDFKTFFTLYYVLLIALAVMWAQKIKSVNGKYTTLVASVVILFIIPLIVLLFNFVNFSLAEKTIASFSRQTLNTRNCTSANGSNTSCGRVGSAQNLVPAVTINNPRVINDDGSFFLTGNMYFRSCTNSSHSRYIYKLGPIQRLSSRDNTVISRGGYDSRRHWHNVNQRFSVPLSVSQTCGVQTVNLRFVNCVAGECGRRDMRVTLDLGVCGDDDIINDDDRDPDDPDYNPDAFRVSSCSPYRIPNTDQYVFTADTVNAEGDIEFKWYEGNNDDGSLLKTETRSRYSTLSRTYTTEGNYQVFVTAEDEEGNEATRICGLQVGGIPPEGELPPPPVLSFDIDKTITNDICTVTWDAQFVSACSLVGNAGVVEVLDSFSGSKDVTSGTYWIECIALRDGSTVRSETRTCFSGDEKET